VLLNKQGFSKRAFPPEETKKKIFFFLKSFIIPFFASSILLSFRCFAISGLVWFSHAKTTTTTTQEYDFWGFFGFY